MQRLKCTHRDFHRYVLYYSKLIAKLLKAVSLTVAECKAMKVPVNVHVYHSVNHSVNL